MPTNPQGTEQKAVELLDRWPGYSEQSWLERFNELDRLYNVALDRMTKMMVVGIQREAALATRSFDTPECPSCHGLNTSCPDGCGRNPETGELNGTRLLDTRVSAFGNLLAVIHRDGGQKIDELGWEAAAQEAERLSVERLGLQDRVAGLVDEAQFLVDRLAELERDLLDDYVGNDFSAHVAPSAARMRMILASFNEGGAVG